MHIEAYEVYVLCVEVDSLLLQFHFQKVFSHAKNCFSQLSSESGIESNLKDSSIPSLLPTWLS
jgi:hypothetical protein